MRNIYLTLDYELFGDGSGDVFKHVIAPTNRILTIVDSNCAKLTIFFEVVEYWKLKEEWEKGNKMGYRDNPILAMEEQLRDAYKRGHSIQLHFHPQWLDAEWIDGGWTVNNKKWRLSDYNSEKDAIEIRELFSKGIVTLKKIIDRTEYECTAIRAGGYNAQPSEKIVDAMRENGLKTDSSIYPGGKESGYLSRYDYTHIPKDWGIWNCGNSLEDRLSYAADIVELPIVALPMRRWKKYLSVGRIKAILGNLGSAKKTLEAKTTIDCSVEKHKSKGRLKSLTSKIDWLLGTEWQTWDFCLFSSSQHRKFLKAIREMTQRKDFVLVGHPKSFASDKGMKYLFERLREDDVVFKTM